MRRIDAEPSGPGRSFALSRLFARWCFAGLCLLGLPLFVCGAEVMPPPPPRYFNDFAGVTSLAVGDRLNRQLEEFEKKTSSQVVVAVFQKMESASSIQDYVHRMFTTWKIGQKGKNNGVLLAVFVQDRKMWIAVGYGLEGVLPDARARRIVDDEIAPHFKRDNYEQGLAAGVAAILAAAGGEYKGTGATTDQRGGSGISRLVFNRFFPWNVVLGLFVLYLLWSGTIGRIARGGKIYGGRRGRRSPWGYWGGGGWGGGSWGGGGWGGGGGGGGGWGGGGGFTGGGGSSGGGGAGGSW
jgi:uncharacterized protein